MPKFEPEDVSVQVVERLFMLLTLNEEGAEDSFDTVLSEVPITKNTFLLMLGLTTNFVEECAEAEGLTELDIINRVALRFQRGVHGIPAPEVYDWSMEDEEALDLFDEEVDPDDLS